MRITSRLASRHMGEFEQFSFKGLER